MYIPMFIDSFLQNVTINVKRDQVTHQLTFGQGKSYADNISSQIIHDADCRPTCKPLVGNSSIWEVLCLVA